MASSDSLNCSTIVSMTGSDYSVSFCCSLVPLCKFLPDEAFNTTGLLVFLVWAGAILILTNLLAGPVWYYYTISIRDYWDIEDINLLTRESRLILISYSISSVEISF